MDRQRPEAAEDLRARPEEDLRRAGVANMALLVGPALVVLGLAGFLLPVFGSATFLGAIVLLGLAPGVLAVGWPRGAPAGRGRTVVAISGGVLALATFGAGLLANPCANDPLVVAVTGAVMALVTFAIALAIGRAFAGQGQVVVAILASGAVGSLGFFATAYEVLSKVFLLC